MWKLTSNFQDKYCESLVNIYSTYRTQGLKNTGAFTPDLDQIFVQLALTPKSPEQVSNAMIRHQESSENLNIWDCMVAISLQSAYRRIVIMGAAGTGKTKLLEHLTLVFAKNEQRKYNAKAPKLLPILLSLRQISQKVTNQHLSNLGELIPQVIKERELGSKIDVPSDWFEDKLIQGKCLVMLDGLDEIMDNNERKLISNWIDSQIQIYSKTIFIVTSRPKAYKITPLKEARIYLEIQPFSLQQKKQFLHNWCLQNELLRQALKEEVFVREKAITKANNLNRRVKNDHNWEEMTSNPLILTMVANFSENRGFQAQFQAELYQEICELLLSQRQQSKDVSQLFSLTFSQKQYILQVLALELMYRQTSKFTLDVAKQIMQKQLSALGGRDIKPENFLQYIDNVAGLLVETEPKVYQFVHQGFQQFLAAAQIKETKQEHILIENIDQSWWSETIRLYAAMSDTTLLVLAAWKKRTIPSILTAFNCIEEGKSVDTELTKRLKQWLEEALESSNREIASFAAQVNLSKRLT